MRWRWNLHAGHHQAMQWLRLQHDRADLPNELSGVRPDIVQRQLRRRPDLAKPLRSNVRRLRGCNAEVRFGQLRSVCHDRRLHDWGLHEQYLRLLSPGSLPREMRHRYRRLRYSAQLHLQWHRTDLLLRHL
jgi:hypothetical protein